MDGGRVSDGEDRQESDGEDRQESDGDDGRARPSVRGLMRGVGAAIGSRPAAEVALVAVPLPALLLVISMMPESESWRLSLAGGGVLEARTTLWTAFASSFVHTDTTHLADNVLNYWLLVGVAYPLSLIAGWRRRFLYATLIYLAVVPLVSAWTTLTVLGPVMDVHSAGFSDVNSALLGYLVVVWFAALSSERTRADGVGEDSGVDGVGEDSGVDGVGWGGGTGNSASTSSPPVVGVDARWSLVVAFGSLALVFAVPSGVEYFPALPAVGILFGLLAAAAAAGLYTTVGRPRLAGLNLPPSRELLYVAGASVAVAGVVGSLVVVPFGSNVYAHVVGYAIGFTVPFLATIVDG